MTFQQLFPYFAAGVPIKRKKWLGYWKYHEETKTINIFTKEGLVIPIFESKDVLFTVSNVMSEDWEIATNENCSIEVK